MYDLPPGFGSPDEADRHLGLASGASTALGASEQSFISPGPTVLYMAGGAVIFGGIGGVLGAQKDMKTALIAGSGAAIAGLICGYFAPVVLNRMAGR
jgi:hypothetical protein